MKKLLALALMLSLMLIPARAEEIQSLQLGSSALYVSVDISFIPGALDDEDFALGMVGYYFSPNYDMDFDVYQWTLAEGDTQDSEAEEEAVLYEAQLLESEINGIRILYYFTNEWDEGILYPSLTCLMQDGESIVELVFWLDGEDALIMADEIMHSLECRLPE